MQREREGGGADVAAAGAAGLDHGLGADRRVRADHDAVVGVEGGQARGRVVRGAAELDGARRDERPLLAAAEGVVRAEAADRAVAASAQGEEDAQRARSRPARSRASAGSRRPGPHEAGCGGEREAVEHLGARRLREEQHVRAAGEADEARVLERDEERVAGRLVERLGRDEDERDVAVAARAVRERAQDIRVERVRDVDDDRDEARRDVDRGGHRRHVVAVQVLPDRDQPPDQRGVRRRGRGEPPDGGARAEQRRARIGRGGGRGGRRRMVVEWYEHHARSVGMRAVPLEDTARRACRLTPRPTSTAPRRAAPTRARRRARGARRSAG